MWKACQRLRANSEEPRPFLCKNNKGRSLNTLGTLSGMDLTEKLGALAPSPNDLVSDTEWQELRTHIQLICKQDALEHGFTSKYKPIALPLEYVMYVYDMGRQHKLPREWVRLMHQMRVMKTPDYKKYLALQREYSDRADVFAKYEEPALPLEVMSAVPSLQPQEKKSKLK
jgi:hypothetical protein